MEHHGGRYTENGEFVWAAQRPSTCPLIFLWTILQPAELLEFYEVHHEIAPPPRKSAHG